MKTIHQLLGQYWGFRTFRPMQEAIINAVLDHRDTVALLPTGGGKSLCFQLPALAREGICIVISPLVALMADQVETLRSKGIKAMHISGGIPFSGLQVQLDNASYGNYKFLYLSPERLQQEMVQNAIRRMPVNLIAVDEAHCISQWGHDFRPPYKKITLLREMHPMVPIIALTATATPEALRDTIAQLKLERPAVFKTSFVRPNISYQVLHVEDKAYKIRQLLKNINGKAIIYVRSRKIAETTSTRLGHFGVQGTFFHGGLSKEEKQNRLLSWKNNKTPVIVATNAFGMGIDSPDVRLVIHLQLPESLAEYFQEAGRAGRDGKYARAIVLFESFDKTLAERQFIGSLPTPSVLKQVYRHLNNYFQVAYGEGGHTRHNLNFVAFCSTYKLHMPLTYNALNTLDRLGVLRLSKQFGQRSVVRFLMPAGGVLRYFSENSRVSPIGKSILRMYGGIFETGTNIDLQLIATKTGQTTAGIISMLKQMERDGVIFLVLKETDAAITFLKPREDD
ncbi:MAG: RecQ family ATP-dependent DNA helicase, partial [Marinirhabdus sp.]